MKEEWANRSEDFSLLLAKHGE